MAIFSENRRNKRYLVVKILKNSFSLNQYMFFIIKNNLLYNLLFLSEI